MPRPKPFEVWSFMGGSYSHAACVCIEKDVHGAAVEDAKALATKAVGIPVTLFVYSCWYDEKGRMTEGVPEPRDDYMWNLSKLLCLDYRAASAPEYEVKWS